MKVPKDPNLYLTVFMGIGVTVVMAFWLLTPVYTPHLEHEPEHASVKPEQALGQVDAMLTAAEKTLVEMDVEKGGENVGSKDKPAKTLPAQESSNPAKVVPASVPDAGHDMAGHESAPEESFHSHEAGSTIALGDVKTLEELAQVGGQLFEGKGQCAQCHSIQGESSSKGPTLEGIGAKLTREFLHESLVKPDAYVYLDFSKIPPAPYAAPMTPTSLDESEVLAVIAYLQQSAGQPISIELSELK